MKIFPPNTVADIKDRNLEEIQQHLQSDHDFPRSKTAILIGHRINEDYNKYSDLLLREMNNDIHFLNVRFGIKSAWTIAIVLIENLKKEDYGKIKSEFDKWDTEEKTGLIDYLKDHPDYIRILKTGQ